MTYRILQAWKREREREELLLIKFNERRKHEYVRS